MLIVFIIISFFVVLCIHMQKKINDKQISRNNAQMTLMNYNIDSIVSRAIDIAVDFKSNPYIQAIANGAERGAGWYDDSVMGLSGNIKAYQEKHNINGDMYIYIASLDMIVDKSGWYTPYAFYSASGYSEGTAQGYYNWKEAVRRPLFYSYNMYMPQSYTDGEILCMTAISSTGYEPNCVLVCKSRLEFGSADAENMKYAMVSSGGLILFASSQSDLKTLYSLYDEYNDKQIQGNSRILEYSGKQYIVSSMASQYMDCTYLVAVDYYKILKTEKYMYLYVIFGMIMVMLCVFGLWCVVKKNYNYVNILIERTVDEYKSHRIEALEDRQKSQARAINFHNLLMGNTADTATDEIGFESDYFAVVLLYVENGQEVFSAEDDDERRKNEKLIRYAVKNVSEELAERYGNKGYIAELEDIITLIISFPEENIGKASQQLYDMCVEMSDFMMRELKLLITFALSGVQRGINGISVANQEAMNAFEYRLVFGEGSIIAIDDIEVQSEGGYEYSFLREKALGAYIKTGNEVGAVELVEGIFDKVLSEDTPNLQKLKCIAYDMAGTLIRMAEEILAENLHTNELIANIGAAASAKDMEQYLIEFAKRLCLEGSNNSGGEKKLSVRVLDYIEGHYADPNLNLYMIAESIGMSEGYVSKIFKEQQGVGILEYINRLRIERAKELLEDKNLKVNDIAQMVGYIPARNFLRVFKKYVGVTPTQYRDSLN